MTQKITVLLLLLFLSKIAFAQTFSVHLNGNETYPINNESKTYHPILWNSSEDERGLIIGGFGLGVSYSMPLKEKVSLKAQINGQRSRYYDEPTIFIDENGAPLGVVIGINTNLNASLLTMAIFPVSEKIKLDFGIGLGCRGTFVSKTDYGVGFVNGFLTGLNLKNKSYSPVTALLPFELTKRFGSHFMVTTRAEMALTKVSRLSTHSKERSMVLFVELGYRFGKNQ